ncbi:DUF1998 domain-containing protein [Solirubrobacter soli]|uniref:DUF1998 domain-containing protein n=1 Tax=Solirubrobacter soli TaxID=363832 RepID=UPI0009FDA10A|nr:DUF1998 domain-containing protein [Solirubrobacter soli]
MPGRGNAGLSAGRGIRAGPGLMSRAPVRRAHMISPFGPGAMLVAPDGTSMIAAGLDHWFGQDEDGTAADDAEFRIEEWRLQRRLGVGHFRLPPDYRRRRRGHAVPNVELTVPFLRFPQWHFCPWCKTLREVRLEATGRQKCTACEAEGRKRFLAQVPFVAMCDAGHLQDFPWREWVHRSAAPGCRGTMKLFSTGGATLANQRVTCSCGAKRNLGSITQAEGDSSFLARNLEPGTVYNCNGVTPQHGSSQPHSCNRPLRGSLRAASNVYFGVIRSAIYLPATTATSAAEELVALILATPDLITRVVTDHDSDRAPDAKRLRAGGYERMLRKYSDPEVEAAAQAALDVELGAREVPQDDGDDEESEEQFRRAEAAVLSDVIDTPELTVQRRDADDYAGVISAAFSTLNLVERLRETRVLAGFSRIFPEQPPDREHRLAQLWKVPPPHQERWLPGYCVFGEGLFLRLSEARLKKWEAQPDVREHVGKLVKFYAKARAKRDLRERDLTARFVLVHTLAHLLMNQLSFECGYSSAALKERLYVSSATGQEQAAVLIYTAAGDAEGTMGGLVRMGKPDYLEDVLDAALRGATWCASDPVCMEIGMSSGQGPDSCNLAACHSCALVPETACEEFNRFLDRGLVVGTPNHPELGFFPYCGWEA